MLFVVNCSSVVLEFCVGVFYAFWYISHINKSPVVSCGSLFRNLPLCIPVLLRAFLIVMRPEFDEKVQTTFSDKVWMWRVKHFQINMDIKRMQKMIVIIFSHDWQKKWWRWFWHLYRLEVLFCVLLRRSAKTGS